MAIKIEKNSDDLIYYYSDNGTSIGPLSLSDLLDRIDSDTMVYREGIDWTSASDVEELKEYFESKSEIPLKVWGDTGATVKAKSNKKYWIIGIAIALIIIIGFGFMYFKLENSTSFNSGDEISSKVFANVKKRNKIIVGTIQVRQVPDNFNQCMNDVFGDRVIKFVNYDKIQEALNALKEEKTDFVILTVNEIQDINRVLDLGNGMVWEGYSEDVYLAFPKNNQIHLTNVQECLTKR
jgi:hypothetical protein